MHDNKKVQPASQPHRRSGRTSESPRCRQSQFLYCTVPTGCYLHAASMRKGASKAIAVAVWIRTTLPQNSQNRGHTLLPFFLLVGHHPLTHPHTCSISHLSNPLPCPSNSTCQLAGTQQRTYIFHASKLSPDRALLILLDNLGR